MKQHILLALGIAVLLMLEAPEAHAALSSDAVSKAVGVFFKEAPIMVEVARCESNLRQYDDSGKVLRGGYGGSMIGLFQLSEVYHRAEAFARGFNIDSLIGNMAYARDLYREEGTVPWDSSAGCWQKNTALSVVASAVVTATGTVAVTSDTRTKTAVKSSNTLLTKVLAYGMHDPEVRVLQQVLTRAGYQVSNPGEESDYFDVTTYKALARFQCDHELACKTRPDTLVHIGRVDAATRKVINTQNGAMS